MIKIRKISDISELTVPQNGYVTMYVDKDEKFKAVVTDVINPKIQALSSKYRGEQDYLRPINCILVDKKKLISISESSKKVGCRAFCLTEFSIYEWNGESWTETSLKNTTAIAQYLEINNSIIIWNNNKYYISLSTSDHITNYRNPHKVTKSDVGLGNVTNEKQVDPNQWNDHVKDTNNPHGITKKDIGLENVRNVKSVSKDQWTSHVDNHNNPHKVTKSDVGLGDMENIHHVSQREFNEHSHDMNAILEDLGLSNIKNTIQADYVAVDKHVKDTNNPHGITKSDIGLDQVENIHQYDKSQFDDHVKDTNNPHGITKSDIGLDQVLEGEQLMSLEEFNAHNKADNPHQVTKEQIGLGNVLNIPSITVTDYNSHLNVKNPHNITKDDIGLGNIENIILVPLMEYEEHVNANNPHRVTKEDVGLGDIENIRQLLKHEYEEHVNAHNPHQVTKEQIGLSSVKNIKSASKAEVENHINRTDNPHQVTKEDVGLGNVENIADINYPFTNNHRTLVNQYVDKDDSNQLLGTLKNFLGDYPEKDNLFKKTIFPIYSSQNNNNSQYKYISPKIQYAYKYPIISFSNSKHGCIEIGNDLSSILNYNLNGSNPKFNNFVPIHGSINSNIKVPPVTTQRASYVQDSLKRLFIDSTEPKSNFNHHRIESFESGGGISYTYDVKNSANMILLDQYNDKLLYYHNNPLNTFCDPTKILFTQEGNIIGIPRNNSKFLLLVDVNKSGHDKYKYVSFEHYGRVTDCYIQVVKGQPTLNRIVTVERNDDYNRYVIKSMLIDHTDVHADVLDNRLTNILTIYTSDILKFYVSAEGIQYVVDGKCKNYSFDTKKVTEFTYGNNEQYITANEFYQYGDYYYILHSNYNKLAVYKRETGNIRLITEYSLKQNFGIKEISLVNNILKIVTEYYIFVIKNEDWSNPYYIYKCGSYYDNVKFAMLTYNSTFDTKSNELYRMAGTDQSTRVMQSKLFDSYTSINSIERNFNIRSFRYSDTSIDISTTDVVCMLNKDIMQLVIIHQEIDPDKMNDPVKFEKYNNQEFIGSSQSALSYYHNDRLITIGHNNNYREAVVVSNPSQSLNLDDSMFDKFICREKDKKEICQILVDQTTMLNEYDFRLISDLPVQNIQKIVTVDYAEGISIFNPNRELLSVSNGMLILYDGGKLVYYDWNLNSLVEKEKTNNNYLVYNNKYTFPYIKDDNVMDIQSDFGTTIITKSEGENKSNELFISYFNAKSALKITSNINNTKILGKLYNKIFTLCGKSINYGNAYDLDQSDKLTKEYNYFQYLKGEMYDFGNMKKYNKDTKECTLDIDFIIPSTQSKDNLVAIKEVLNGYLLIQIGGEIEVTYNKWMVDFGIATAIPESISRKPTFYYRE